MTREQRKIIYWAAMFEIEAFGLGDAGLCAVIGYVSNTCFVNLAEYPELNKQKPKDANRYYPYWFPPGTHQQQRLKCLSRAIDLCEE